jgi:hypothetical protein
MLRAWRLIIVWLEVRVLPAPPHSLAQEISRLLANSSELARLCAKTSVVLIIVAVIIIVAPVSSSSDASIVAIVGFCLINRHHDA